MKKYLIGLFAACCLISAITNADTQTNVRQQPIMSIQIIKDQLDLTKQSFKSVQIVKDTHNNYAVQVELTPNAAKQMHVITAENINHVVTIVWHRSILNVATIQSPIGAQFQIAGLNQQQAEAFVNEMRS